MNKKFWVMSELGSLISMYRSDGATSENCPKNSLTFCRLTKPKKGKVVLPSYVISIPTSHTWFTLSLSSAHFRSRRKNLHQKNGPRKGRVSQGIWRRLWVPHWPQVYWSNPSYWVQKIRWSDFLSLFKEDFNTLFI